MPNQNDYFNPKSPLNLPRNRNLPFCAYGIFKPGQLAYSKIKKYVEKSTYCKINYKLLLRDGVPLITPSERLENNQSKAYLIYFKEGCENKAYKIISNTTSNKLYSWKQIKVNDIKVNVLMGKNPEDGINRHSNIRDFDGREDPLFKDALELIENNLKKQNSKGSIEDFFTLQMNYMLLWSVIERFSTLKYNCKGKGANNTNFSKEPTFKEGLEKYVKNSGRKVYSSEDLTNHELDVNNPREAIRYYYTLRCNMVHKGKETHSDVYMIYESLVELLQIVKDILDDNFKK